MGDSSPYRSHEKREGGPKQRHALFECPRNTEDEEEGEERVLVALGPEIGRFGEYCTGPFRRTVRSQQKRDHQRTFMLGECHESCADRWRSSSIYPNPRRDQRRLTTRRTFFELQSGDTHSENDEQRRRPQIRILRSRSRREKEGSVEI